MSILLCEKMSNLLCQSLRPSSGINPADWWEALFSSVLSASPRISATGRRLWTTQNISLIWQLEKWITTMKLKKRKIKYAAIFLVCWFALLVLLVDGILKFQTLVDWIGSYALVETILILLVILPTVAVYIFTKEK